MSYQSNLKNERELRAYIVEICRRMYDKNFVAAGDGNVSVKLSADRFLTTPSGQHKGYLHPDQMVVVDARGQKISGDYNPSSEMPMHLAAYAKRPDIGAVIHAHPPISTAFSIAGISLAKCILPEVVLSLGMIPTTRYATPTTSEGAEVIQEHIGDYDALILERHGSLTVGKDLDAAYMKLERIEHAAMITYIARDLGHARPLSRDQVSKLLLARQKLGLKSNFPGCDRCGACLNENADEEAAKATIQLDESLIASIVEEIIKEGK
ncbi:MAG: class II aldolase/adducin family protein [Candidatus Schekmanbacteria bacterium]|nr:class II aldolase/adducin family protein [Candidatus Schekmanbacteria bacterium]